MEYIPPTGNIYQNNIMAQAKTQEQMLVDRSFRNSMNAINTNVIPRNFNENILNKTNKFKLHEQLPDMREHNQNDKNYMISPLSGQRMPMDKFSHNNMTPFFGSNATQSTVDNVNSSRMEHFSGDVKHFRNKMEIPNMFDPQFNVNNVNGAKIHTDETFQRYIASNKKQNETPIRPVQVGPGLNAGFTSQPQGGFQQANSLDYIKPKNVDELRVATNPKLTYRGRIIPGQKETQRGLVTKPSKNKPETYYRNSPERYMTSVVRKKNRTRDRVNAKKTNRQCSVEYTGGAGPTQHQRPTKRGLFKKSTRNCYVNSGIRNANAAGNWSGEKDEENYGKNSINLPLNERDTTQKDAPLLNLTTIVKSVVAPLQDVMKTSRKENYIGNIRPTGNFSAAMPGKMTVHDANDVMRTTIKETNIHDTRSGNINGHQKMTVYDPNDIARTTIKETNIHDNRTGNLSGPSKIQVHDPNDVARTTIKETNIHDNRTGNLSGPSKIKVHDPNDVARTTIKETNIHDNRTGNLKEHSGGKNTIPLLDEARVTVRNTVEEVDKTLNLKGANKLKVHDPNDVPQATIKDTNIHHVRTGNMSSQGQDKTAGYMVKGVKAPNTNRQFTSDKEYTGIPDGDVGRGNGEGYLVTNYEAKNTSKEFLSDNEYTGVANSEHEKPMSYDSSYNAQLNYNKEKIAEGRSPTKTSVKLAVGQDNINIDIKKLESDIINIRDMNVEKIYSSVPGMMEGAQTNEKVPLQQNINVERLEDEILQAFKENPFTQSLSSF